MKIEVRADGSAKISGYVNVVERESRVLMDTAGQFVEKVKAKVFDRAIGKADKIGLMFNHARMLGDTATNLELHEDAIGLHAECTVSDAEVVKKARAGELRGWSFGFYVNHDSWASRDDGMRLRSLEDIDLIEVSILDCTPAYIATSVEVRAEGDNLLRENRLYEDGIELIDHTPKEEEQKAPQNNENLEKTTQMRRYLEMLKLKA